MSGHKESHFCTRCLELESQIELLHKQLYEALEQPVSQELVATVKTLSMGDGVAPFHYIECNHLPEGTKLYTAPHPAKLAISQEVFNWIDANAPLFVRDAVQPVKEVELTDDELLKIWQVQVPASDRVYNFARAAIAKYKSKNKNLSSINN